MQWALAYLAGAFVVFQSVEVMAEPWGLSPAFQRSIHVILIFGLFVTLVLAWYHGEKGRQRVSGPELLMVAALLVLAGVALKVIGGPEDRLGGPTPLEMGDRPSIAVLPFTDLSETDEGRRFSNQFHSEMAGQLLKIEGLEVKARASASQYRYTDRPLRQIGEELGVQALLTADIRIVEGRVRISVELVKASTEEAVWTETFDQFYTLRNRFDVQAQIARSVADELQAELLPEEAARIAELPTQDPLAYQLYWRTFELEERIETELDQAILLLHAVIQIDPEFAAAYARLGNRYYQKAQWHRAPPEIADSVVALAEKALYLDPDSPDAYRTLGAAYLIQHRWDARDSVDARALEIDPGNPRNWNVTAWNVFEFGECDEAFARFSKAIELDPRYWVALNNAPLAALCLDLDDEAERLLARLEAIPLDSTVVTFDTSIQVKLKAGDFGRAREDAEEWVRIGGRLDLAYDYLAQVSMAERNPEAARAALQEVYERNPDRHRRFHTPGPRWTRPSLAWALLESGEGARGREMLAEARSVLEESLAEDDRFPEYHIEMATVHALSGETDEALHRLDLSLEMGGGKNPWFMRLDPRFDSIRSHPRFEDFMERLQARVDEMRRRYQRGEVVLPGAG